MKTCKRILTLALALLIAAAFPVSAAADAWIPPDDLTNNYILSMTYNNGECLALNAFVSNYVEANLPEFESGTSDDVAIAGTLKHFELNPGLYPDDVSSFVGDDGKTYMKVSASRFEARAKALFDRNISASACPGYEDGYITVTAENYGAPIRVFGTVSYCAYLGDGLYSAEFVVFYVPGGVTDEYGLSIYDITDRGYTSLGSGTVQFYFDDPTQTSFRSSDFRLVWFTMDVTGIPYTNANLPMANTAQAGSFTEETTEPETTETPTEQTAAATGESVTEPEVTTEPEATEPETTPEPTQPAIQKTAGSQSMVILIVVLVIVIAVLALAVILLLFKVKKK